MTDAPVECEYFNAPCRLSSELARLRAENDALTREAEGMREALKKTREAACQAIVSVRDRFDRDSALEEFDRRARAATGETKI